MSRWDEAVVIALGSNLKGPYASSRELLEAAVCRFRPEGLDVVARSSWWASSAWPDPSAPPFLNGVAIVETALDPHETLAALGRIEQAFGRDRHAANAPRTLDLDLIAHGRVVDHDSGLVVPHPRARDRRFVMGPLAEIAPDWRCPETGDTAEALLAHCTTGLDARALGPEPTHRSVCSAPALRHPRA